MSSKTSAPFSTPFPTPFPTARVPLFAFVPTFFAVFERPELARFKESELDRARLLLFIFSPASANPRFAPLFVFVPNFFAFWEARFPDSDRLELARARLLFAFSPASDRPELARLKESELDRAKLLLLVFSRASANPCFVPRFTFIPSCFAFWEARFPDSDRLELARAKLSRAPDLPRSRPLIELEADPFLALLTAVFLLLFRTLSLSSLSCGGPSSPFSVS